MTNVNELCRLCASSQAKVVPIFGEDGNSQSLADKIHTHLPIVVSSDWLCLGKPMAVIHLTTFLCFCGIHQVTPEDCMPTTVCTDCVSALDICHNLLRSCVAADERLRKLLGFEEDPDHTSALDEVEIRTTALKILMC